MNKLAYFIIALVLGATACNKTDLTTVTPDSTVITPEAEVATGAGGGGTVISDTDMPQTAKDGIVATFAGYTITKIERDTERNVIVFEVHINNGIQKKTIIFDKDWKIVSVHVGGDHHTGGDHKDTIIVHTDLPKPVKDSLTKHHGGFTVVKITKERKNGVTTYEVEVKDAAGKKKTVIFDGTGHARKEEAEIEKKEVPKESDHNEGFKLSELAQAVKTYVTSNYAGYKIEDVVKVTKDKVITFEVDIKKEKLEKTLVFNEKWVFVKVK